MNFAEGDAVEVKVGGSLGRWVLGVVDDVQLGSGNRFRYAVVSRGGQRLVDLLAAQVRAPRRTEAGSTVPMRTKRTTRKRADNAGRGPLRYPNYLKWVKSNPCIFCGRKADDPHHVGSKGLGQQTDDTKIVAVSAARPTMPYTTGALTSCASRWPIFGRTLSTPGRSWRLIWVGSRRGTSRSSCGSTAG